MTSSMAMPRNPGEAEWFVRSAEEEAARAARWASVAEQNAAYHSALAKAHAADAAGLRRLWNLLPDTVASTWTSEDDNKKDNAPEVIKFGASEAPKCLFCGNPTRFFQGKPQKFCSFSPDKPYSCSQRFREKEKSEQVKRAREAREQIKTSTLRCDDPQKEIRVSSEASGTAAFKNIPDPACLKCGKTTRIWHGKPQKFCSPPEGQKASKCALAYHDRARRAVSSPRSPRRKRTTKQATPSVPSGSVLVTASPRTKGHDLLAAVSCAVPEHLPWDVRQDIIGEAILLVCTGTALSEAIAQATKMVRKDGAMFRYAKPIEECFWLAAEASGEGSSQMAAE